MTHDTNTPRTKPLHWVGSAKKDYLDFPADVQSDMGYSEKVENGNQNAAVRHQPDCRAA
jgi:phage-related protein